MRNIFFSIIISIFNKKEFIKKGISYILNQNFKNYEIILIDDGSTDGSCKICKELTNKNSIVTIFLPQNQGIGYARNKGLENAKGKYICFFDIDDQIKNDWLEKIYELIIVENPDVLIYSYNEINPQNKIKNTFKFKNKIYISNDEIKKEFVDELSGVRFNNGFVWNKVYKRDFLISNNITFPDLRIQQDEVFNLEVYKHAKSLITSSEVLYDYFVYEKGNTRNTFIQNRIKIFEEVKDSFLNLAEHWQLGNEDLKYYIHSRFVRNCLYNRNPIGTESFSEYRDGLFQNNSLKDSVIYMLENSEGLSKIERIYLNGIIKKSDSIFSLADIISTAIYSAKGLYRRLFKSIILKINIH